MIDVTTMAEVTTTTSRRSRKPRSTASPEDQERAILDAAEVEFATAGVSRANMDEVARSAGVSRSTLYRRFPNKDTLLTVVATRVYERGMARLEESVAGLGPRAAVAEAFAVGAEMVSTDPLMRRLVIEESEMRDITSAVNALFIEMVSERVAQTLRTAGAEMPDEDLREATEIHVRLVISYLENPAADQSKQDPDAVRELASKFLAPMIW